MDQQSNGQSVEESTTFGCSSHNDSLGHDWCSGLKCGIDLAETSLVRGRGKPAIESFQTRHKF